MSDEGSSSPIAEGKIVITDLLGVGKATEKLTPAATELVRSISSGLGRLYEPASIYFNSRAENAADRHNALADAKAYQELTTRSPHILESARRRILGIEYRREENIIAAEREAVAIAQVSAAEEAKPIQPDFMVEWLEGVKDVSDEMVRSYWARVLAEAPATEAGRVPKPVIDFLKLLDHELCQQLEYLYRASFSTNGKLFEEMAGVHPMAEEIGLGSFVRSAYFETNDRTLQMVAHQGSFPLFEIGARATLLCEIAFPVVDEAESLRDFYKSLPDVMRGLKISGNVNHMTIEVRDDREHRHLFDVQFLSNDVVRPRRGGNSAGVLRDMKLTSKACGEELRQGLIEVADWMHYRGSEKVKRLPL